MKPMIFKIGMISLLVTVMFQPVQAAAETGLENRIRGWISAVNEGNYDLCLRYVAPPPFRGKSGLSRITTGSGEALLLFSGEKLLPLREYKILRTEWFNNGYESKVTIAAKVIYQRKPLYIKNESTFKEYDMLVYPATITQRWLRLNGQWFIMSISRLQYLGPS